MRSGPRTEVYLRSDIANILAALRLAASTDSDARHRAGYMQALAAVGAAFGVEVAAPNVWPPEPWEVVPGNGSMRRVALLIDGKVRP